MLVIDAHQHTWNLTSGRYRWPNASIPSLNRSFSAAEGAAELAEHGIVGSVLVQVADDDDDTAAMLAAAAAQPKVLGVVGWVGLDDPRRADERLETLGADPAFVGVRALTHTYADPHWLLRPEVAEGLGAVARHGLPYDLVTSDPDGLRVLPRMGETHPSLSIVIDHLGKPPVGGSSAEVARWRYLLTEAAANPMVTAKISGLHAVGVDPSKWRTSDIRPFVDSAVDLFGPSRLMYAGDWPVCNLAGGYGRWWHAVSSTLSGLPASERAMILGGTAERVYRLDRDRIEAAVTYAAAPEGE